MLLSMLLHSDVMTEPFPANIARVRSYPSMKSRMLNEIPLFVESPVAMLAFVGFVGGMNYCMPCQKLFEFELLVADFTLKWRFVAVRGNMFFERVHIIKFFPTNLANFVSFIQARDHVIF